MARFMIASKAANSFEDFCARTPTDKIGFELACLMDFVEAWVVSGEGIYVCNGDYHTYTIALVGIIDKWISDPGTTDHVLGEDDPDGNVQIVKRRVDSIFEGARYHRALEQYWFERKVFAYLNPLPENLTLKYGLGDR